MENQEHEVAENAVSYKDLYEKAMDDLTKSCIVEMELMTALGNLLKVAENNICSHEETYRGGAIWEICSACGAKWADDQGGKPEFKWPDAVEKARELISSKASGASGVPTPGNFARAKEIISTWPQWKLDYRLVPGAKKSDGKEGYLVSLSDVFEAGQWWVSELESAVANGTPDQQRAVAVVHNLLRQIAMGRVR